MKEYIMKVVGAAILLGISEQLLPPNAKLRSYIRLFGSLCLLLILIAPLGRVIASLPDWFDEGFSTLEASEGDVSEYEKILEGTVKETVQKELSAALLRKLTDEFGVSEETRVGVSFEDGTPLRVKKVLITVSGKDMFRNPYEMEEAVTALLGCECVVVVD